MRFTFTVCCLLWRILVQTGEALGVASGQGSLEDTTSAGRSSVSHPEENAAINHPSGAAGALRAQAPLGGPSVPDMEQVQDLNIQWRLAEGDIFLKAYIQQVMGDWNGRGEALLS
jgi:hypothetical protein